MPVAVWMIVVGWLALLVGPAQERPPAQVRETLSIPKVWDDEALASMELPLANPSFSPRHVSSDYYYKIPIRPIYKSYPIYSPDREPPGYMEFLAQQEPEVAFDPSALKTDADWIRAGEFVFDAPIGYGATFKLSQVRDPEWLRRHSIPLTKDGIMPFSRYVIRKKGVVEVGGGACLMCHARVMPNGSLLKGAQGNFPVDRVIAFNMREQAAASKNLQSLLDAIRLGQRTFFSVPWLTPNPVDAVDRMSIDDIANVYDRVPAGVTTRVNLSLFQPAQIPDLIGVKDIRHLDHTGMVVQRSAADLMRYTALVQGANSFDRFGSFALLENLPDPKNLERYSDEQLYALAMFLYSLQRPTNPNKIDAAAERGRRVFTDEGCVNCHTPPLYTSNKLTPVDGFTVPREHLARYPIIERSVGTDNGLALQTRKGTGYYKVPSLRGIWYRGRLQHSGAAGSLEEWLDPKRTIKGHPFGLKLDARNRAALIAFLKTL
jgi:cytochrome c2